MTEPKFKYNMKKTAYLLPPARRTVARFINLSHWVERSAMMPDIYHTLQADGQKVFSFIPGNASLIDELSEVIKCIKIIEHHCKHDGLSKITVAKCRKEITEYLLSGNSRMRHLGECIADFLTQEIRLTGTDIAVHNNSSDILESLFGRYKDRKSPNRLNGVTPYILFLPIYTGPAKENQTSGFDFKAAIRR
jgi:hypothetical protein